MRDFIANARTECKGFVLRPRSDFKALVPLRNSARSQTAWDIPQRYQSHSQTGRSVATVQRFVNLRDYTLLALILRQVRAREACENFTTAVCYIFHEL